jgi:glycosyl transferase, family 25
VKAYVINLGRSEDRRAHMEYQLKDIGAQYEITEAVDGQELDLNDGRLFDPVLVSKRWYRSGMAGCALSHLRVYRRVLEDGHEVALVLEDDTVLPTDLCALADVTAQNMTGAEVVLLNFHTAKPCQLTACDSVQLPSSRLLVFPLEERKLTSAGAYLITREACERIERDFFPLRYRSDEWALKLAAGYLDRVRCVVPLPVRKDWRFVTTIQHPTKSWHGRLQRLARCPVPGLYQVLAMRRQFIDRRWSRTEFVPEPAACRSGNDPSLI